MQRFYRKLLELISNGWAWGLDYLYVGYWQIYRFFIRSNAKNYIRTASESQKVPLVFIPGIYENWRFMKPIADFLYKKGYSIHIVSGLGYNVGAIEDMAIKVDEYLNASGIGECIIIAHSKGGLIGKYLMSNYPNSKIRGMVALNTPFVGSRYATLFPIKPLQIFLPNSPVLALLTGNSIINKKITSIYGQFDPHIPEGSYLKGAVNIQLKTKGHFKIMSNRDVHSTILESIERIAKK